MPVTIPDYEIFKAKTSVLRDRFHRSYGTKWKSVHMAYQAYKREPSEQTGEWLFNSLDVYLLQHGKGTGNFIDHERDQDGFLQGIYEALRGEYKHLLSERRLENIAAQEHLDTHFVTETRLGVLECLSQIEIDGNFSIAATVVHAVAEAGNILGNVLGTDLTNINTAKNAQYSAQLPGTGADITSKGITSIGHFTLDNSASLLGRSGAKDKVLLETVAPPSSFQYPQTLAAINHMGDGLIDSYLATDYFSSSMITAHNSIVITGQVFDVGLTAFAELSKNTFDHVSAQAYQLWLKMKAKLKEYIDKLVERFSQDTQFAFQFPEKIISALLKITLKMVMGTAMPFIGNAVTLAHTGLSAITHAISAAVLAYSQKNVVMNAGHPELIARYIIDAKWGEALSNACRAIASAALVAVDVTVPGVGSLVNAISAACQWIYGVVHQYFTVEKIKLFLEEAKVKWGAEPADKSSFVSDTGVFTAWFEKGCRASVLIPAIVVRSGKAGDWHSWFRLTTDAGTLVPRETFDAGLKFINNLQAEALRVVRDSAIKILPVNAEASNMVAVIKGEKMTTCYEEVEL